MKYILFVVIFIVGCNIQRPEKLEIYAYRIEVPFHKHNVNYRSQYIVLTNDPDPNNWFEEIENSIHQGVVSVEQLKDSVKYISFVNISDLEQLSKGQRYCSESAISVWTVSSKDTISTIPDLENIEKSFFGFHGRNSTGRIKRGL